MSAGSMIHCSHLLFCAGNLSFKNAANRLLLVRPPPEDISMHILPRRTRALTLQSLAMY